MAGVVFELSSNSSYNNGTARPEPPFTLLETVQFNLAWVLFTVFLVAFVANSVLSAEEAAEPNGPVLLGPGGKPLPRSARRKAKEDREKRRKLKDFSPVKKLLFLYLTAGVLGTFLANGTNIVVHALVSDIEWWCGKAAAVSGNTHTRSQQFC